MNFWSNPKSHLGQTQGTKRKDSPNQVSASVLAVVAATTLTGVIGDRFYNQPQLAVDTIATRHILIEILDSSALSYLIFIIGQR